MEFRMSGTAISPSTLSFAERLEDDGAHFVGQNIPVPATFTFVWRGTHFRGELDYQTIEYGRESLAVEGSELILIIRADLGPVPYSSENAIGRKQMLDFAQRDDMGPYGSQRISAKKRLEYAVRTRLPGPAHGVNIMTAAVTVLLQSEGYFARAAATLPAIPHSIPKIYAAEHYSAGYH